MTIDTSGAMRKLSAVERQADFALARALTWSARDAAKEVGDDMPKIFDRPTPFIKRAMVSIPAKKADPVAYVTVKDQQVEALARQQVGGTRTPRKGKPIALPVGQRVNRYGNIPKGAIARELAKDNTFFASGKDARTRHLPPGVYRRTKRGTRRDGSKGRVGKPLKLLVAMEREAQYEPRFDLHERVGRSVLRTFPGNYNRSLAMALESAKVRR